jgi:hypothetical protein
LTRPRPPGVWSSAIAPPRCTSRWRSHRIAHSGCRRTFTPQIVTDIVTNTVNDIVTNIVSGENAQDKTAA